MDMILVHIQHHASGEVLTLQLPRDTAFSALTPMLYERKFLEPQRPGYFFFFDALGKRKWIKLFEIKNDHGKYRTELNNYVEHFVECFTRFEIYKFVKKYKVPRRAYGKPLGNTFNYTEKQRLKNFKKSCHKNNSFQKLCSYYISAIDLKRNAKIKFH